MLTTAIVDVDLNDPEASFQAAIDDNGITASGFISSVIIREEAINATAKVVIYYDDEL